MEKEIVIEGVHTNYTIDEQGVIRKPNGTVLKPYERIFYNRNTGTQRINFVFRVYGVEGKCHSLTLHHALASAFIPNPNGYKHVHFRDGNMRNLSIDNLYWSPLHVPPIPHTTKLPDDVDMTSQDVSPEAIRLIALILRVDKMNPGKLTPGRVMHIFWAQSLNITHQEAKLLCDMIKRLKTQNESNS